MGGNSHGTVAILPGAYDECDYPHRHAARAAAAGCGPEEEWDIQYARLIVVLQEQDISGRSGHDCSRSRPMLRTNSSRDHGRKDRISARLLFSALKRLESVSRSTTWVVS